MTDSYNFYIIYKCYHSTHDNTSFIYNNILECLFIGSF